MSDASQPAIAPGSDPADAAKSAQGVPAPAAPPGPQLSGGRVRRAGMLSLLTYGLGHGLRLASNLILTRLLFEEAFGVMALVTVFVQGLQLFSDIGIRPAIVQNKRGEDPQFLATAFSIQAVRGVILYVVALLGAAPFASFYDLPELATLLPVAGLNAVVAGLNSTKLFTLGRQLALGKLAIVEIGSQVVGLLTTVGWALASPSVWALVFGGFAATLAKMVMSHAVLPGRRDRFGWNRDDARELMGFGRWIFLSTALSFLGNQSDRLILGKLLTVGTLGVYNIALLVATMPAFALASLSNSVLFPVLSRAFERGENPSIEYRRLRLPILLLGGFVTSGIAGGAPIVIDLLYDDRYLDAGSMLRVLGVGSWFSIVEVSAMYGLLASGGSKWMASSSAMKLAGTSLMIPLGYTLGEGTPLGSVLGALIGFALADVAKYAVVTMGARRAGIFGLAQDMRLTALWFVAAGLATVVATASAGVLGDGVLSLLVRAAGVALTVALVWAPLALMLLRERRAKRA